MEIALGEGYFDVCQAEFPVDVLVHFADGFHAVVEVGQVAAHDQVQGVVAEPFEGN